MPPADAPLVPAQPNVIDEFVTDVDAHYKTVTGKSMTDMKLDPISIITAILAILAQMCPKPAAELKAAAQAQSSDVVLAATSATRQALREQHPNAFLPYVRYNGKAIATSILAKIASRDEAKIQAGLDCCAH